MSELSRDRELDIQLSAIMARGRFTHQPQPVIDELRAVAGRRTDILASTVGQWIGFYESKDTRDLTDALRESFADLDLAPGIALGVGSANEPHTAHTTSTGEPGRGSAASQLGRFFGFRGFVTGIFTCG